MTWGGTLFSLQGGCDFESFKVKFVYHFCFFFCLNGTDISSISSSVEFNISVVDVKRWSCSLVAAVMRSV